jgi:hypothetical protein
MRCIALERWSTWTTNDASIAMAMEHSNECLAWWLDQFDGPASDIEVDTGSGAAEHRQRRPPTPFIDECCG